MDLDDSFPEPMQLFALPCVGPPDASGGTPVMSNSHLTSVLTRALREEGLEPLWERAAVCVVCGPYLPAGFLDIKDKEWLRGMYNMDSLPPGVCSGSITGIATYARPHLKKFVVHVALQCKPLADLRRSVVQDIPGLQKMMDSHHKALCLAAIENPLVYDTAHTTEPGAPWAHIPLAVCESQQEAATLQTALAARLSCIPPGTPVTFSRIGVLTGNDRTWIPL